MTSITQSERHLVFTLGREDYAVPILGVREVIQVPDITPIPQAPSHYLGVINLRGQVISVVDLRFKLKGERNEQGARSAVIILDFSSFQLGVLVSAVKGVAPLGERSKPRPPMEGGESLEHVVAIAQHEGRLVLLLDVAKSLSLEEIRQLGTQQVQPEDVCSRTSA